MPPKKESGGNNIKASEQIIALLAGLFILAALVNGLINYTSDVGLGTPESIWDRVTNYFLDNIWPIWKIVAFILSTLLIVGIIRNVWKLRAINIEENEIYNPRPEDKKVGEVLEPKIVRNERWEKVLNFVNSANPSDWRLAIIEADVMLESFLRSRGYAGDSIGDMLKTANKNDFITLDDAWEAHKFRNLVAHAGSNFQLTDRETHRIVSLFEKVFQEFGVI